MDKIFIRFRNYVCSRRLIIPGDRVLLSLSAGKDSMFMLHLTMKLKEELDFETGIFHLNHLTRGDESDQDEVLVRKKAEQYGIPCYAECFDFKNKKISGMSFEEQARNTRYGFLKSISEKEGYTKIATAHNSNDNAETVLMRILSGTGISGIKGILPLTGNIIRPVLFADKNEIYEYLKTSDITWREDLSNADSHYLRNYTRNIILPATVTRFPDAEDNLCNLADHAAENQQLLCTLADTLYPDAVTVENKKIIIDIDNFKENIPLIKFCISRVLAEYYGTRLKISIYNEIVRRYMTKSANKVLYENEVVILRKGLLNDRTAVYITDREKFSNENVPWEYNLTPDDNAIRVKEIKKNVKLFYTGYDYYSKYRDSGDHVFLQSESDIHKLSIRNRRDGDRITFNSGTVKIKKLMIEKKLDSNAKKNIPLIVTDGSIAAYLPGIVNQGNNRIACNFLIKNNTKRILAIFFTDY